VVAQPRRQPPDQGGEDGPVGPIQAGSGVGTATSCRSTNSSTSLAEVLRPSSKTSLSIWRKIRYSSRSDTAAIIPDHRRRPIPAGQHHVRRSGTPHPPIPDQAASPPATPPPTRHAPPRDHPDARSPGRAPEPACRRSDQLKARPLTCRPVRPNLVTRKTAGATFASAQRADPLIEVVAVLVHVRLRGQLAATDLMVPATLFVPQ
jgi:hypothetical protein